MGRAVGAEEEFGRSRHGRAAHGDAVALALGDGQAISVRADAALEDRIAIEHHVVRRDGGGDRRAGALDEGDRLSRRDMFEDDLQRREIAGEGSERPLDKDGLAVENVDGGIGHLAVDEERHPDPLHRLQCRAQPGDVGHAVGGVGGGVGRIELGRHPNALGEAARDFLGIGIVREIAGHQRREAMAVGQRGKDAIAIGAGGVDARHRRHQVRHHDRAGELARGIGRDRAQHLAVAQVHMPVVGAADRDAAWIGHHSSLTGDHGRHHPR